MGHKEATITIELHNPDGKNDVIRRKITKDGKECKTSWMLNGEKVSQKRVSYLSSHQCKPGRLRPIIYFSSLYPENFNKWVCGCKR